MYDNSSVNLIERTIRIRVPAIGLLKIAPPPIDFIQQEMQSSPTSTHQHHHHHAPQDAGYNHGSPSSSMEPSLTEQIESLEQALKLQIQKRIEAETKTSQITSSSSTADSTTTTIPTADPTTSTSSSNQPSQKNNELIQSYADDLNELIQAFISEVDGLDGDEAEEQMGRRDVLWMLGEVSVRIKDISSAAAIVNEANAVNDDDHDDDKLYKQHKNFQDDADERLQEQFNIAVLQGRITQLLETNQNQQLLLDAQKQSSSSTGMHNTTGLSYEDKKVMEQYRILHDKHHHMIHRHGNVLKEMQQSLHEKNAEIRELKRGTSLASNDNNDAKVDESESSGENNPDVDGIVRADVLSSPMANGSNNRGQAPSTLLAVEQHDKNLSHQFSPMSPMSPFLAFSPHKDLQIVSLQEDIDDRDSVIAELKAELDSYTIKRNVHSMETDRVKIKYLEGIITDLLNKLNGMERAQKKSANKSRTRQSHGDAKCGSDNVVSPTSAGKYSSLQWDWSGSNLVDKMVAPDAFSSLQFEDMELKIAELLTRLQDSEEEKVIVEEELRMLKESGPQ
jgi:hypothetical protein